MKTDIAIDCAHVSKTIGIPLNLKSNDTSVLRTVFAELLGRRRGDSGKKGIFLTTQATGKVLNDLSLTIQRGSVVGLIGPSGSGRSMLLRAIAGTVAIDTGKISTFGSISALLDQNGDLNEDVSASENVEEYCRLNRIRGDAVGEFCSRVLKFAELHHTADTPIRYFSTGMRMRLRIAIALEHEADIFLIDDVLEVGDLDFQRSCIDRLKELAVSGATIVISVDDEALLRTVASRAVRMERGSVVDDAEVADVVASPTETQSFGGVEYSLSRNLAENEYLRIANVEATQSHDDVRHPLLHITVLAEIKLPQTLRPTLDVRRGDRFVFRSVFPQDAGVDAGEQLRYSVDVPLNLLAHGDYVLDFAFVSSDRGGAHSLKTKSLLKVTVSRDGAVADTAAGPLLAVELRCTLHQLPLAT